MYGVKIRDINFMLQLNFKSVLSNWKAIKSVALLKSVSIYLKKKISL